MIQTDKPLALILDMDSEHTRALALELEATGFAVTVTKDIESLTATPALALLSMDLDKVDAIDVMSSSLLADATEVILMADEDDPPRVHRGIANGATYFFCKPFDPSFLQPLLRDIRKDLEDANADPSATGTHSLDQFGEMRGSSPAMRKLYRVIRKVAATDTSVLLIGESGVGKELAARTLHQLSDIAEQPFIATNCAAIPKDLFESELFGHEKGSFSGAEKQHAGFFERADGGRLFLDELTEMPLELQAKLLRVLETGQFRRIGGESDINCNVQIIAATNREPAEAIRSQSLREDLFYRIARFPIWLPPLRSRSSDILGLTHYFLAVLNDKNGTAITISENALEAIQRYSWPGNVRELRSSIERAHILADKEIELKHLPEFDEPLGGEHLRVSVGESIADAEKKLIMATLEATSGDKKAAAEYLGVSLKTLYNRLHEYESDTDTD